MKTGVLIKEQERSLGGDLDRARIGHLRLAPSMTHHLLSASPTTNVAQGGLDMRSPVLPSQGTNVTLILTVVGPIYI